MILLDLISLREQTDEEWNKKQAEYRRLLPSVRAAIPVFKKRLKKLDWGVAKADPTLNDPFSIYDYDKSLAVYFNIHDKTDTVIGVKIILDNIHYGRAFYATVVFESGNTEIEIDVTEAVLAAVQDKSKMDQAIAEIQKAVLSPKMQQRAAKAVQKYHTAKAKANNGPEKFYIPFNSDYYEDNFMDGFDRVIGPFSSKEQAVQFDKDAKEHTSAYQGLWNIYAAHGGGRYASVKIDPYGDEPTGINSIVKSKSRNTDTTMYVRIQSPTDWMKEYDDEDDE